MHFFLVSQMLSSSKSKSWGDNSLNGGVVSMVHEKDDSVHGAIDLEVSLEESSSLQVYSHCRKNNGEVLITVIKHIFSFDKGSLSTDLSTNLVMGKTSSGEEWDLLSSGNGGHGIDGGDTCLDHLLGVDSLIWVNWLALNKKFIVKIQFKFA
jgi:hypothetical protein